MQRIAYGTCAACSSTKHVGAPARDVGGQRGGAVEGGFPCVPEVFAAVVEVDHVDGVVAFLAGKQTESFAAPPVLGELGVFGGVIRQFTEFHWLAQTDAPLQRASRSHAKRRAALRASSDTPP